MSPTDTATIYQSLTRISGQLGGIEQRLIALEQHGRRLDQHAARLDALERDRDTSQGGRLAIERVDATRLGRQQRIIGALATIAAVASVVTAVVT